LDRYYTSSRGGGQGWVILSEEISHLLQGGSVTFLHGPTWDAISAADQVAGRLWTFLEAESLGEPRRYSLFAAPPRGIPEERNLPAIAELLRLEWGQRRDVARRVQRACAAISDHDPRYILSLIKGQGTGMWRLEVARHSRHTAASSGLPAEVLTAWKQAYPKRVPSVRQAGVLREILSRRPASWVAAGLIGATGDPLRHVMDADAAVSQARLSAAAAQEAAWETDKRAEASAFEPLSEILRRLAAGPRPDSDHEA
jgi:hypothetical protein